jgi:hypothetical protein
MDPVTSPLIHKDSGHQAQARSGRGEPLLRLWLLVTLLDHFTASAFVPKFSFVNHHESAQPHTKKPRLQA